MINEYLTGALTGAGLIIAIGPQNAFVITQGLKKQHSLMVAFLCSLSDVVLIGLGVLGMGRMIQSIPWLLTVATILGSLLLYCYGIRNFISAWKNNNAFHEVEYAQQSIYKTILFTLGITFLNPSVYLDTMIFLGSMSATYEHPGNYYFGLGAMTMSFVWFFGISIGAVLLAPLFKKKRTWQILDIILGILMWVIATKLIFSLDYF
ncbi:LysE/ArgO family amino acid transporter [Spirochaeta cellobiosiphila]|uniref:LysE/ArgO family amino acid transporter n=1 Tax=Spirochaeta cellobiosiphila TaxID=504483 RepID=UPI0003F69767|nr:LysE/ArgO family amino acid transporter [Spirochaeta cellobiosiphila]